MADQTWVGVQTKAFTRWCNVVLAKRKLKIDDIFKDLKDGLLLIQIIEQLTGKEIKHNPKPRMDVQRMENIKFALDFLKENKTRLVNLGAEDIFAGNVKLTLGLIWTMILNFQLGSDDGSANKDLLDWVNSVIPHHKVGNFTKDWQNGKALSYLVEALRPGTISAQEITSDGLQNCRNAIKKAKDDMEIPEIVDPEDMAERPDALSNMTYISYFREYEKQRHQRELLEATIVAIECIAAGPGLQPGVSADNQTGFTIEARNAAGRRVKQGGATFAIKVTGPSADVPPNITDGNDGTYIVEYTATEQGNHFIQVTYQNQQIKGSPFQVPVTKAVDKPKPKTIPLPHWYYEESHHEGLKQVSKWICFDDATSDAIETAWRTNPYGAAVDLLSGQSTVDFTKMTEKSNTKKHAKRKIIRGVWFFQDDDGTWAPYDAYTSQLLENEFQTGQFRKVNVSDKPPRWVISFADGSYKQFRQTKGGNPNGRGVLRGYKGQSVEV